MHNQQAQGSSQMANKNLDHEQGKLVEKNYAQSKATNVNLNSSSQPMQNDNMMALNNSGDVSRPKRYSSFRQRSNVNEPILQTQGPPPNQQYQQMQQQQQQDIQNVLTAPPTQNQNYMQSPPQMQTQSNPAPAAPQQKYPPNAYYVNQGQHQASPQSEYAVQQQVAMAQYQQYQVKLDQKNL